MDDFLEVHSRVEGATGGVAGGGEPPVGRDVTVDADPRDDGRLVAQVLEARGHRLGVRTLDLVQVEVSARGPVAALARDARVGVAAKDRRVALHAGSLHIIGVGETHRLGERAGLRAVELLPGVEVGLDAEGGNDAENAPAARLLAGREGGEGGLFFSPP